MPVSWQPFPLPCDAMTTHYPTIADCIGNTPLVRLQRMPGKTS
ncbi:MAG: cysteine synthase B, partial [Pseudomonas sp.]|nr:cysteine synthase B [Pseudomonas sp.]